MKTGIVTADPRKVCWKTYMYHGILRRCRVSCEPGPVITPPIGPAWNPMAHDYEADCFPEDNPDPMISRGHGGYGSRYLSDGLFCLKAGPHADDSIHENWAWNISRYYTKELHWYLRFVAGIPTLPPAVNTDSCLISLQGNLPSPFGFSYMTRLYWDRVTDPVTSGYFWRYNSSKSWTSLYTYHIGTVYIPITDVFFVDIVKIGWYWHLSVNGTEYDTIHGTAKVDYNDYWGLNMQRGGVYGCIDYSQLWLEVPPSG